MSYLATAISEIPSLARGEVWCRTCGRTQRVNSKQCLSNGWPKCCGYTMTIDSPKEQAMLKEMERLSERAKTKCQHCGKITKISSR